MSLRVVIADDHPLFRAGIVRTLEEDPRFVVVGEAGDGAEAEALIRTHDPELALLDLRMPGMDGLALLARLRHHTPPVAVVVLTAYTDASLVHSAMDAGAAGYVAKDCDRAEILDVIVDAAAGRRRVRVADAGAAPRPHPRLSLRERTVLSQLNAGWALEDVALLGDMAPKTVAAHLANARRRLGAATNRDAIASAAAWGLLTSPDEPA
jgi:two-component system nitrate/nitrite response regulator NarL